VRSSVTSGMMVLLWLKLIVSILPPYVFTGMAVSLALTRSPWPVGQVYGVDLIGAASEDGRKTGPNSGIVLWREIAAAAGTQPRQFALASALSVEC
jgi:hypothetical protein